MKRVHTYLVDANLRMAKLLNIGLLTYLFLFCLVLFYTLVFVYYDCFRFVCTFESLCLNNCKMKRNKQRTLFEFDVFCENEEMGRRGYRRF